MFCEEGKNRNFVEKTVDKQIVKIAENQSKNKNYFQNIVFRKTKG